MVVLIALVVAVGFGLATDYEVFLVSRMVEARARGMSTAEAIRIGTATTGRLITAAALVLAVVAGSFVVLRPGDDEVSGVRSDGGTSAGRHRRPDVPGARGDEAARRRLLVGPDVDAAPAEPVGARRDSPARRAQAAVAAATVCSAGNHPPAGHVDTPSTARPHASQRRRCAAAEPTGCASAPAGPPAAGSGRTIGRRHHENAGSRAARAERGSDDSLLGSAEPVDRTSAGSAAGSSTTRSRGRPRDRVLAQRLARREDRRPAWRRPHAAAAVR